MAVIKRRTRMVIFRLTEEEYADLKSECASRGARNVSDFARTALLESIGHGAGELRRKLDQIESGVNRLEQLIKGDA